jgi:hypothetical protein
MQTNDQEWTGPYLIYREIWESQGALIGMTSPPLSQPPCPPEKEVFWGLWYKEALKSAYKGTPKNTWKVDGAPPNTKL